MIYISTYTNKVSLNDCIPKKNMEKENHVLVLVLKKLKIPYSLGTG